MPDLDALGDDDEHEDRLFEALDLEGVALSGRRFTGCTFRHLRGQASRWQGAHLEDCAFENCDLTGMVPGNLRAHDVRFVGCKLLAVRWTRAMGYPRLGFEDCLMRYAAFSDLDLRRTELLRCRLTEASFTGVDSTDADFAGSDLTGATFQGTTLAGAYFSTTEGLFLDPARNRVKGARVPVETAVLLAMSLGLRVRGYDEG